MVDIVVNCHDDRRLFLRAMLDTGMEGCAISEEKALETGLEIEQYTGSDIIVVNGDTFRPLGYIELQFRFQRIQGGKSWRVQFMVVPSVQPFGVALGRNLIFKAELLVRPSEGLQ
jgi:hypothetical protein